MMMMMTMMISQTLMRHPLELVNIHALIFTTLLYDPILCIGNIKGSTSGVDHDSGLGTSRYKSTMSHTMSDVRTLCLPK